MRRPSDSEADPDEPINLVTSKSTIDITDTTAEDQGTMEVHSHTTSDNEAEQDDEPVTDADDKEDLPDLSGNDGDAEGPSIEEIAAISNTNQASRSMIP